MAWTLAWFDRFDDRLGNRDMLLQTPEIDVLHALHANDCCEICVLW